MMEISITLLRFFCRLSVFLSLSSSSSPSTTFISNQIHIRTRCISQQYSQTDLGFPMQPPLSLPDPNLSFRKLALTRSRSGDRRGFQNPISVENFVCSDSCFHNRDWDGMGCNVISYLVFSLPAGPSNTRQEPRLFTEGEHFWGAWASSVFRTSTPYLFRSRFRGLIRGLGIGIDIESYVAGPTYFIFNRYN